MNTGKIVRMMTDKKFGFIKSNGKDYFFHMSGCITEFDGLKIGDDVQFDTEKSDKGPRAVNVELV